MNNDYCDDLTYEEKIVFLKILCKMIKVDGEVDVEELGMLSSISKYFGVAKEEVVNIIKSIKDIDFINELDKINNRQHALELIKELCVLANIDEDLHDRELDFIVDVARALNVEDDKVVLINRWVLDSIILNKAGQIIMEKTNE